MQNIKKQLIRIINQVGCIISLKNKNNTILLNNEK